MGVPLIVTDSEFSNNNAPLLQNAQLLISNDNVSDASALLQALIAIYLMLELVDLELQLEPSLRQMSGKYFQMLTTIAQDSNSATEIFDGGINMSRFIDPGCRSSFG